jgi:hypothetical protein
MMVLPPARAETILALPAYQFLCHAQKHAPKPDAARLLRPRGRNTCDANAGPPRPLDQNERQAHVHKIFTDMRKRLEMNVKFALRKFQGRHGKRW